MTAPWAADLAALDLSVSLAELERAVIAAEAEAGRNVPDARRRLSDAEFASGVRFGDIDALVRSTADRMVMAAQRVTDHIMAALPSMALGKSPTQLAAQLTSLASPLAPMRVPGIERVMTAARDEARAALIEAWTAAAQGVIGEVAVQGAETVPLRTVKVDPDTRDIIYAAVDTVMAAWVARALTVAAETARVWTPAESLASTSAAALSSAFNIVEAIRQAVAGASTAGAADLARQGAHQTVSASRGSQAKAPGMPPIREVYASELLDAKTCPPCAEIDGTQFVSMEEAWLYYREHGGFQRCEGGLRCRGVLVIVWDTELAPSVNDTTPQPPPALPEPPAPVPPPAAPAAPKKPWAGQPGAGDKKWAAPRFEAPLETVRKHVDTTIQQSGYNTPGPAYTAWNSYTGSGYTAMNGHLRGKAGWETVEQRVTDNIDVLTAAIEAAPPTQGNMLMYRGVKDIGRTVKAGDILVDEGFVSASTDYGVATGFAYGDKSALFRIRVPKGAKGIAGSPGEAEVIFQRGTSLIITRVTTENGRKVIDAILNVWEA